MLPTDTHQDLNDILQRLGGTFIIRHRSEDCEVIGWHSKSARDYSHIVLSEATNFLQFRAAPAVDSIDMMSTLLWEYDVPFGRLVSERLEQLMSEELRKENTHEALELLRTMTSLRHEKNLQIYLLIFRCVMKNSELFEDHLPIAVAAKEVAIFG